MLFAPPSPVLPLACCPRSQSSDLSEHKCHLLIFLLCLCKGCSSEWNQLHPPCHHVLSSWFFRSHLMCVAPESPLFPFRLLPTFVSTPGLPPSQATQLYLSLSISFLDASGKKLIFPIGLWPRTPSAARKSWAELELYIALWVPDRPCPSSCTVHRQATSDKLNQLPDGDSGIC